MAKGTAKGQALSLYQGKRGSKPSYPASRYKQAVAGKPLPSANGLSAGNKVAKAKAKQAVARHKARKAQLQAKRQTKAVQAKLASLTKPTPHKVAATPQAYKAKARVSTKGLPVVQV